MKTTETVQKECKCNIKWAAKIEAWYKHVKDDQDSQGNDGNF